MAEYLAQHAASDLAITPPVPMVEYGMAYDDITDPNVHFQYDYRIGHYEYVPAAQVVTLPRQPIIVGEDWREQPEQGMLHNLHALFNYRDQNFAIATTYIDELPFTYVTLLGSAADQGEMVYALDAGESVVHMYDHSDKFDGEPSALLTLRRTDDGTLELINESVWPVQVGTAYPERQAQPDRRGRFSVKNVYHGLKRALRGTPSVPKSGNPGDKRQWDSRLSAKMTWKPPSYEPMHLARYIRSIKQPAEV